MHPATNASPLSDSAATNQALGLALIALAGVFFTLLGLKSLPQIGIGLALGPAAFLLCYVQWRKLVDDGLAPGRHPA